MQGSLEVAMTEPIGQRAFDGERAACADAWNLLQAAVVGSLLQLLQRVGVELVVNARGKLWPDARNGLEQLLRLERTRQSIELVPASRGYDLDDRRSDAPTDAGQFDHAFEALIADDLVDGRSSSKIVLAARRYAAIR